MNAALTVVHAAALSDEWAHQLEAARRAHTLHEQAGPDEATL